MAGPNVAATHVADKPTFVYGLIDPRNHQLRYIGKTVLLPERRILTHRWRARSHPHKRHSMAWLLNLEVEGLSPEIVVLEEIPPGRDWVEAEQFWIAYFRMIGADLCNHTDGGEGVPGYRQPPSLIAKRIKRGSEHHRYGKPMLEQTKEALRRAGEVLRADPVRNQAAIEKRRAGMTPERMARSVAGLRRAHADPEIHARSLEKKRLLARTPEARARVSAQSRELWATKRSDIIAAQNAGKDDEWRKKQSALGKERMKDKNNPLIRSIHARRKLSDQDVADIRRRLAAGETPVSVSIAYGVSQSLISYIKTGRKRRRVEN